MKRIWLIILIGSVLLTVCVGNLYLTNQKDTQQKKTTEAERMSVVKLKETFAGIESVKFNKAHYNSMIGGYMMDVTLTYQEGTYSPTFTFTYWEDSQRIGELGIGYDVKSTEGVTLEKVKVKYLDGKESDI